MNKVLGIDLGTTYSCVSYIDSSGKPVVQKNSEGELTTPSVVFFESPQSIVVGTPAKESSKLYPQDVVSFAKSSIGRPGAMWYIQGAERTPEEISSYILRKVVGDAVTALQGENKLGPGETIADVVITCPAYFGIAEREATHNAGNLAGLNVLNIINEPTAAAITYGVGEQSEEKVVLVYDLGGGTFDVTMIDISKDAVRVICTGGDHSLGGKMWDDRIMEYVAGEFARQTGSTVDILSDMETFQELSLSVERAKKMLSSRDKAPIAVNYGGDRARVELTREKFDSLTEDLLERTILLTQEMLEEATKKGYSKNAFAEVLMVGGSTRMPQVKTRIAREFAVPVKIFDPDEAVAKGAAIFASRQAFFSEVIEKTAEQTGQSETQVRREIQAGKKDVRQLAKKADIQPEEIGAGFDIVNVASRSFGTIALRGTEDATEHGEEVLYNMITKNTELPAASSRRFFTVEPDQRTVTIRVLESLCPDKIAPPGEGTEIGEAILELPEGLPAGSPLEIEFTLSDGGLLELEARETTHSQAVAARFETTNAVSESELRTVRQRVGNTDVY